MREKLIEILSAPIYPHELVDPIEAVADYLIDSGVTIQKWIPVTERLPEQGKCVLIYSDTGKVAEGQYTVTQDWTQFRWSAKNVIVTHWMPLPEPPSGERRTDD